MKRAAETTNDQQLPESLVFEHPTLALDVETYSGKRVRLVVEHDEPIHRLVGVAHVPYVVNAQQRQTYGTVDMYHARTVMVPDLNVAFERYGVRPPINERRGHFNTVSPPEPGEVVGFVNYLPLTFLGWARPTSYVPALAVCVFEWKGNKYISTVQALKILCHGGPDGISLMNQVEDTVRQKFYRQKNNVFTLASQKGAPYDTLLLIKRLNIAGKQSQSVCMVDITVVDNFLRASYASLDHRFDWTIKNAPK